MDEITRVEASEERGEMHLKPCPFCANNSVVYLQHQTNNGPKWIAFCPHCTASVRPGWAEDKIAVAEIWTRRSS